MFSKLGKMIFSEIGLILPSSYFVSSLENRILKLEKRFYLPRHPVVSAAIDTTRQVSWAPPTLPLSVLAFSSVEFERHEDITEVLRRSGEPLFRVAGIRRFCLSCQKYVSLLDAMIIRFLFQSARDGLSADFRALSHFVFLVLRLVYSVSKLIIPVPQRF